MKRTININIFVEGVGSATIYYYTDAPKIAYFCNFRVYKEKRKRGLGTILIEEVLRVSKKNGFKEVYLWAKEKSWTRKWYERNGFVALDEYFDDSKKFIWIRKKLIKS